MKNPPNNQNSVELGGMLQGMSLPKQILTLTLWPFLQNMLGTLVSVSDRMIAGATMSPSELPEVFNAMGLIVYVAWLLMIVLGAIATGAQAIVARAFGAKNQKLTEEASGQALTLGLLSGVISGAIVWLLLPALINMFGLTGAAADYALDYLNIIILSVPFSAFIFVANGCLRAGGDTKTPFGVMLVVNVINVLLSLLLMKYSLNPSEYGIAGLAWGTFGGWLIGAMLMAYVLFRRKGKKGVLNLKLPDLAWNWVVGRRITRIAVPQCIEILGMWSIHIFGVWMLSNHLVQKAAIGAHGLVVMVESISFMPGFALGTAASTLAGQYLGAGSKDGALRAVRACWITGVTLMGSAGLVIVLFAEPLVRLMSPVDGVQNAMAVDILHYVGWVQPFFATAIVLKMAMRGVGATVTVMVASFGTMLVFRVGLVYLAFIYFAEEMTLLKVWWIMMFDLVAQAGLFTILYKRKKWLDSEV